jgi:hypothetical protein
MRKLIATCSAVLIAMAVLGACGGSSDKPAADSDGDSPKTTVTDAPDNSDGNDGGSDTDISKLYGESTTKSFKINFTTDGDGGEEQTYAQDGKGKSAYGSGDSQFFTSSDGSVTCSGTGSTATCTAIPGPSTPSPFFSTFQAGQAYVNALGKYAEPESETIADRDAKCVTFSKDTIAEAGPVAAAYASLIKGSWKYCIDDDTGVLLSYSITDENDKTTNVLTVTKFEEPSDSDFDPPSTPQTIPGQ